MSRNVKDKNKYKEIKDLRLKLKKEKDPRQASLKLIINSTFGILLDKYSPMYDPRQARRICIYNQLFMLDLAEKIEDKLGDRAFLFNANTDGEYFKFKDENALKECIEVINEWSERTGYVMEIDLAKKVVQKDCNNYILTLDNGKVKTKGSMVKKTTPIDNDLPIINKAVREYYINGISVEETINNCNDLIEFQKVYKITSNYKYAIHNNKPLANKVNRVFASKDENDTAIYKLKKDKENADLFAGTPEHCFIDNGDIRNKTIPDNLDKQWYIDLANKRIKMFTK